MTTTAQNDLITDAQLARYATLIYDKTGIRISPQKKTLLSNRIRRRLRKTEIATYKAYFDHVRRLPTNHPEWRAFLQEITTHETYLYRDETQWEWFCSEFLSSLASEARSGNRERRLRILSAACSTGDEPYTMAACIADTLKDHASWKIEILGTDIGVGALEEAEKATFGKRAMRLVPDSVCRRFFQVVPGEETWQAKPVLKSMIRFRQHNLMKSLAEQPFDLVVVKNVLIYFDTASKKQVLGNLMPLLRSGGLLLTGAAEGVSDFMKGLTRIHPWLHRKP